MTDRRRTDAADPGRRSAASEPSEPSEPSRAGPQMWALADRAVLTAVKSRLLGVSDPGRLGKYEIERPLGAGAMGRIFLARDPELERRVALKLIAPQLADLPQARRRIVREARAMARLSDPHVAQVYEVAREGPHLFVVMEYVDGQPLRDWLDERPRPWSRIVDVFVQAGRGLASSHAKGLVHRDFKPSNVMIERGGRAKVVDFGLARGPSERSPLLPPSEGIEGLDPHATATGSGLGTPAYMPPEQWNHATVDARSDQFSFCVALYEALAGRPPFELRSIASMREGLAWTRPPPLRRHARVPRRIEAAIARGLEPDPADRWPAMEPLLHALTPRSRAAAVVIAAPLLTLASTAVAFSLGSEDPCARAGEPMDDTWSDATRQRLDRAMAEVDAPWAPTTAATVLERLDDSASAWRQAAHAVCAAQSAPAEASACLEYAREGLAETIERLASSGAPGLVSAVSHMELLADARACLQPTTTGWLRDRPHGPSAEPDPSTRRSWSQAVSRLGALSTAEGAQRYVAALTQGRALAAETLARAEAVGDRPRVARAAWLSGRLALRDGDRGAAETAFRRAIDVAMEVGDPSLRAAATVELVYVVGNDRQRTVEAITLANEAASILAARGDLPVWTARLAAHRASALAHAEPPQPERAAALHLESLELLRQQLGEDHPDVIAAQGNLGAALKNTGDPSRAQAQLERAIARAERVWGPGHPRTARLRGTLGLMRMRAGDLPGARDQLERSLAVRAQAMGDDHAEVASARYNLALVLMRQREYAGAIDLLWRGLRTRERAHGPDDVRNAEWLLRIGMCEQARGRVAESREPMWRALALYERWGGSADRFGNLRLALARSYRDEDPAKARVLAELAGRSWHDDPDEQAVIERFLATLPDAARAGSTAPPRGP